MVRKDYERLESSRSDSNVLIEGKTIELTASEFDNAMKYIEEQRNKPNLYLLVDYNCVDFIQDVCRAAKGEQAVSVLTLFDDDELAELGWVGTYARLEKVIG